MPDPIFAEQQLADIYDPLDSDRSDLDAYLALVDQLETHSVLDVGCGTGTLACLLARQGRAVTGVEPAGASLEVARRKTDADRVRWLHGTVESLPALQIDLAAMTGNVAQVFLTDQDWASTLQSINAALRPGGRLVFETRDPGRKAWLDWTREQTERRVDVPGVGTVRTWLQLTDASFPWVTFRHTFIFECDGNEMTSDSTLRFRSQDEIIASLTAADFAIQDIRDAPDRPGRELVFVATKQH